MSSSVLPPPDVALGPLEDRYKWFLANLSFSSTPQEIKEFFSEYGSVNFVKIVYDLKLQKSKGYGFLYMLDEQGDAAVEKLATSCNNRITLLGQSRVLLQRHDQSRVQPIRGQYSTYGEAQQPLAYSSSDYQQPYHDRGQPVYGAGQEHHGARLPTYSDGYAPPPMNGNGYSQSTQQLGYSPSGYAAPSSGYYESQVQVPYSQGQYSQGTGQYYQGATQVSLQGPYLQRQYSQGQYSQVSGQDLYSSQGSGQDLYSSQGSGQYSQDPYSLAQYSQGQNPTPPPPPPPYSRASFNEGNMAPRQLYSSMPPRPSRPPRKHDGDNNSQFHGPPVVNNPRPSRPPPRRHDSDNNNNNNNTQFHGPPIVNTNQRPRRFDADVSCGRGRGGRQYNNRDRRRERPY